MRLKNFLRHVMLPVLSCGIVTLAFFPTQALTQPGFVFIAPPAGSVFYPGEPVTITWTGGSPTWNVNLGLDDVNLNAGVDVAASNIPNTGTLNWTVPGNVTCGDTFNFYIENVPRTSWAYGPYFKIVCEIPVAIDIKPGGCSNTINPKGEGIVRVAILSSSTFDARVVDQNSLTFGRTGNEPSLAFCDSKLQDVNGDGLASLVCSFNTPQTGFRSGDTVGILRGKTLAGMPVIGTGSVRIVGPNTGH